jgi:cytochrome c553
MKRLLVWVFRLVLLVLLLAAAFVAYLYVATERLMARIYAVTPPRVAIRSDPASLERGRYLVERVAVCVECHGPDLGGKVVEANFAMGLLVAANITRGRGGLDPSYTDQDFVRVLTHGVRRDGRSVVFMPSSEYRFTEADLGAIIGYVKSVPPVDRVVPVSAPGPMARALGLFTSFPLSTASQIDHGASRLAEPVDASNALATGKYLLDTAGCRGCHGVDMKGGGGPPPGASNITPVGIGDWTEQDFLTALRQHKRPNGSTISAVMPKQYGDMADDDLKKIFGYLKTVPPAGEKTAAQK